MTETSPAEESWDLPALCMGLEPSVQRFVNFQVFILSMEIWIKSISSQFGFIAQQR